MKCQKGHEFCSCGRPLHENDCYHDEKEFKEFLESEKIKKCPKCGFLIKKNKGCNHMTCGNPICRYEFCWLCMKEAIPNHFEYGPCAGKQFYDPDSFSYRLQQAHPCLYCIFSLFQCLFVFISIIIGFLAVPGFGLTVIACGIISENDSLAGNKNKIIRRTLYLICFCVCLCIQSFAYIAWACIFAILGLIVSFAIIGFVFSLITKILKCIFCCTWSSNDSIDINFEADVELGNNNN